VLQHRAALDAADEEARLLLHRCESEARAAEGEEAEAARALTRATVAESTCAELRGEVELLRGRRVLVARARREADQAATSADAQAAALCAEAAALTLELRARGHAGGTRTLLGPGGLDGAASWGAGAPEGAAWEPLGLALDAAEQLGANLVDATLSATRPPADAEGWAEAVAARGRARQALALTATSLDEAGARLAAEERSVLRATERLRALRARAETVARALRGGEAPASFQSAAAPPLAAALLRPAATLAPSVESSLRANKGDPQTAQVPHGLGVRALTALQPKSARTNGRHVLGDGLPRQASVYRVPARAGEQLAAGEKESYASSFAGVSWKTHPGEPHEATPGAAAAAAQRSSEEMRAPARRSLSRTPSPTDRRSYGSELVPAASPFRHIMANVIGN